MRILGQELFHGNVDGAMFGSREWAADRVDAAKARLDLRGTTAELREQLRRAVLVDPIILGKRSIEWSVAPTVIDGAPGIRIIKALSFWGDATLFAVQPRGGSAVRPLGDVLARTVQIGAVLRHQEYAAAMERLAEIEQQIGEIVGKLAGDVAAANDELTRIVEQVLARAASRCGMDHAAY